MRSLKALPKAHLHVHLTACMRPGSAIEVAERHGLDRPSGQGRWAAFEAFGVSYRAARAVLRSPDDLRRLVDEAVADARGDGAVWIEPQTGISSYAHIAGGEEQTLELLLDAIARAAECHQVGVGLVIAANRERDPSRAEQQARLAARYAGRGVVGFGLGGDERHPPEPFAAAFEIAADAGLLRVPHAGELAGPNSVRGALDVLGADRIQHGVRALEDVALVERLAESGVCLDVCITSNVALGVVPRVAAHPLPKLLDAGVNCSLNADAPLLLDTSLLGEYAAAREHLALTDESLASIARSSLQSSAAPPTARHLALSAIDNWLESPADATTTAANATTA